MTTATIYKRQSTQRQAKKGESNRRQSTSAEAYCKANNLTVTEQLSDAGISGFTGANFNKGQLGEFIERVNAGMYQVGHTLVLEHLDRFSRADIDVAIHYLTGITIKGIQIAITGLSNQERVLKKGMQLADMLLVLLEFAQANEESSKKAERLQQAWKAKLKEAQEGKIISRRVPHWIAIENDQFKIKEENAQLVKDIYQLYLSGESMMSIAGILTKQDAKLRLLKKSYPRSKSYTSSMISDILKVQSVYGRLSKQGKNGNGEGIDGYYPAIVSKEDYDLVQAIRYKKNTNGSNIKQAERFNGIKHLFSGLYQCTCCGNGLQYGEGQKSKRAAHPEWESLYRLRCISIQQKTKGKCEESYTLKARLIEEMLWQQMDKLCLYDAKAETETQKTIQKLEAKKQSFDKTIETYRFMSTSGYPIPNELQDDYDKAQTEMLAISSQQRELEINLKKSNQQLLTYNEIKTDTKKRKKARRLIEQTIKQIKVKFTPEHPTFLVELVNMQRYIITYVNGKWTTVAKGLLIDVV